MSLNAFGNNVFHGCVGHVTAGREYKPLLRLFGGSCVTLYSTFIFDTFLSSIPRIRFHYEKENSNRLSAWIWLN